MSRDSVPMKDGELLVYSQNYSAVYTANATLYGGSVGSATALAGRVTAFETAQQAATNPATRTKLTVATKQTEKAALVAALRATNRQIRGISLTDNQLLAIGLQPIDRVRTPVPPPAIKPTVAVIDNEGRSQSIRISDPTAPTRRGKPAGVDCLEVFSYVAAAGQAAPDDLEAWRYVGQSTRMELTVQHHADDVGKTAHIRVRFCNERGQSGPASESVTAPVWAMAA